MWRFALARATGTSHIRHEMPCQDRCACVLFAEGGIVAALADGAGSAEFAEDGAEIAVNAIVDFLTAAKPSPETNFAVLVRSAVVAARRAVLAQAQIRNVSARQLASTLLAVISTEYGGGAAQIGDGVIVVSQEVNDWGWVFWPQRGEYANTTRFLTDHDAELRIEIEVFLRPLVDLMLVSDGLRTFSNPLRLEVCSQSFLRRASSPVVEC